MSEFKKTNRPPIFIFGCVRSGTTLLRSMLNAHPNISCPRETAFFILLKDFLKKGNPGGLDFWKHYKRHRRFGYQEISASAVESYLDDFRRPSFKNIFDSVMSANLEKAGEQTRLAK